MQFRRLKHVPNLHLYTINNDLFGYKSNAMTVVDIRIPMSKI